MRALRDFNLPKIVADDLSVFSGLIGDLFPKIDIPRKRDVQFEDQIRKATLEVGLQAEDIFILKIVQLEELLAVRHCVFVLGNAGAGKSQSKRSVWTDSTFSTCDITFPRQSGRRSPVPTATRARSACALI